jgi:HAD superfamily hydrolase (TIGR01509 family)
MSAVATLFDFNGVLVDDEHVHLEAFRDVVRPLGIAISDADYAKKYLGFDDAGAFRAMLADAGQNPSEQEVRALVLAKKPLYRARIEEVLVVFEGATELVLRRAALGPVAIVSGALEEEIRFCTEKMGIARVLAFIIAAEHVSACKPHPAGYIKAKARLPAHARAVAIEDSLAGVASAKAAGIACAGVAHSYPLAELARAGADVVVPSLAALSDELLDGEGGA